MAWCGEDHYCYHRIVIITTMVLPVGTLLCALEPIVAKID